MSSRLAAASGSSPRGWGTAPCSVPMLTHRRFIPTGVGNGVAASISRRYAAVHPHGGGERSAKAPPKASPAGSSPRGWGTATRDGAHEIVRRFIPTGVGNGQTRTQEIRPFPVHPHGGGERWRIHGGLRAKIRFIPTGVGNGAAGAASTPVRCGSSPRGWGTDQRAKSSWLRRSVHPHGGGERIPADSSNAHKIGSSPRGWGTAH